MKNIFSLRSLIPVSGYAGKFIPRLLMTGLVLCGWANLYAATKTANGNGNWSSSSTWSPAGVPASTDDVVIQSGAVITVDGTYTCHNLNIGDSHGGNTTLQITLAANSLISTGDLQINPNGKGNTFTLNAGPGTVNISGTFSSWSTSGTCDFSVGSGAITFTPAVTTTSSTQKIVFTGAGTVTFNAGFTDNYNCITTYTGCVVNFGSSYSVSGQNVDWLSKGLARFTGSSCTITASKNITFNNIEIRPGAHTTVAASTGTVIFNGTCTLDAGATLTLNKTVQLNNNWTNNGGTLNGSNDTLVLNGSNQSIGGTSATAFPTLQVGSTATGAAQVSCTMLNSNSCTTLILNGNTAGRYLTLASGVTFTVNNNVFVGQPTANSLTSGLLVDSGVCNVSGNLTFTGSSNTGNRVTEVMVTGGAFTLNGNVSWLGDTSVSTEIISISTGTLTFNQSLTMGPGSGTLLVTGAATVNFNGTTAPSFNFGGSANPPVLATSPNCTLNFKNGFTNNGPALYLADGCNSVFTGSGSITPNGPMTFGNIQINSGVTLSLAGNISLTDNWNNLGGTFAPGTKTVTFNGMVTQQITRSGGETFYNLTATSPGDTIQLMSNIMITDSFNMDGQLFNLNGDTLILGNNAGASLVYSMGMIYGGVWKRWFPASAITSNSGAYYGFFPLGRATDEYRPVTINSISNPTGAGYVMLSDTSHLLTTLVAYTDNEGSVIEAISNNKTDMTLSGLTGGTYNLSVTFSELSSTGLLSDMKLETYTNNVMGSFGTSAATTGSLSSPILYRNGLSAAQLSNLWVVGTKNVTQTPLRTAYYSRKSGNWNDVTTGNSTWSSASGGSGASCNCVPDSNALVFIDSGQTVTLTNSATADYIRVLNGGVLQGCDTAWLTMNGDLTLYGTGKFIEKGTWSVGMLTLDTASICSATGTVTVRENLTVPTGATYSQLTGSITLQGNLLLDGTMNLDTGKLDMTGVNAQVTGSGVATTTGQYNIVLTGNKIIEPSAHLTIGAITSPATFFLNDSITIFNYGYVILNGNVSGNTPGAAWINEENSTFELWGNLPGPGILVADAYVNTVKYTGSASQIIKTPVDSTYYNLVIANSGTKSTTSDLTISNSLIIQDSAILNAGPYALGGTGGFTMTGNAQLTMTRNTSGIYPEINGPYALTGGTITISQTADTATLNDADYYNLVLDGTQPFDISLIGSIISNLSVQGGSTIINNDSLNIGGTFTYSSSQTSVLSGSLSAGGITLLSGGLNDGGALINITDAQGWNNSGGVFTSSGITFFSGMAAQQIGGSASTTFNRLDINNPAGVTLGLSPAAPTLVSNAIVFKQGNLYTDINNILRILPGATTNGGSASSFVAGPMTKVGNDDFIFPTGNTRRGMLGISGIVDASTEVTAQYFASPYSHLSPIKGNFSNVSDVEYWQVSRAVSSDSLILTLYWDNAAASTINDCQNLTMAQWLNNEWYQQPASVDGNSICSGAGSGSLITNGYVSTFGPFTFGGSGTSLPVQLLSFTAVPEEEHILTSWATALEINNASFTVERSNDAINFYQAGRVKGAGNSTVQLNYKFTDENPLSGVSYYRLRQTDFNGNFTFSNIASVNLEIPGDDKGAFKMYPNPTHNEVFLNIPGPSDEIKVSIYDLLGHKVYAPVYPVTSSSLIQTIFIPTTGILRPGVYLVKAITGSNEYKQKLIVE